jgi:hypothetical protein
MTTAVRPRALEAPPPVAGATARTAAVSWLAWALAALAVVASAAGLLVGGGAGRHDVTTARGAVVALFGDGLYAADTWLVGAGNRGGDLAVLAVEVPLLLLAVRWYRGGAPVAAAVLAGVLSCFAYYYVSMVFGAAQNRLFPVYVAAAALAGFALATVARGLDVTRVDESLPARPGRAAVTTYLAAVAVALVAAWLPGMLATAASGDIPGAVGPYTSAATEALDLGLVVPTVVLAAVLHHRRRAAGRVLALVVLVLNVCIGVVLLGQGAAQVWYAVPLTVAEVVAKSLTFLALTAVAGGLLLRGAFASRRGSGSGAVQ